MPGFDLAASGYYYLNRPTIEEADVKVVHCPCGTNVEGETDDALVENVEAHISAVHPESLQLLLTA